MRLFVAVEIPGAVRASLEALLAELRRDVRDVRWSRVESIHLTLKFLGEVEEPRLGPLSGALEAAASAAAGGFEVGVGALGTFGDPRRPRVVWAGVRDPAGGLAALQEAVEAACEGCGFPREERAFSPHLTLARPKGPSRDLSRALPARAGWEGGRFAVASIVLFQSLLKPEGAAYLPLRVLGLGAPKGEAAR